MDQVNDPNEPTIDPAEAQAALQGPEEPAPAVDARPADDTASAAAIPDDLDADDDAEVTEEATLEGEAGALAVFGGVEQEDADFLAAPASARAMHQEDAEQLAEPQPVEVAEPADDAAAEAFAAQATPEQAPELVTQPADVDEPVVVDALTQAEVAAEPCPDHTAELVADSASSTIAEPVDVLAAPDESANADSVAQDVDAPPSHDTFEEAAALAVTVEPLAAAEPGLEREIAAPVDEAVAHETAAEIEVEADLQPDQFATPAEAASFTMMNDIVGEPVAEDAASENEAEDIAAVAEAADEEAVAVDETVAVVEASAVDEPAVDEPAAGDEAAAAEETSAVDADALPWVADANPAEAVIIPEDAFEPQPPAVAFAPAFLAVDDEGQPVPDEAVEAIEAALNQPIPALAPVRLEAANILTADEIEADAARQPNGGALWTIPLMCLGIAVIACCLLIPQANENRKIAWEREKLRRDLEQIQKQVDLNERFIDAMAEDALLTQRLAQRQMNVVRAGTAVLELDTTAGMSFSSPFQLVSVPAPEPMPAYVPYGGRFAALCRNPRTQLYMIGGGLLLVATGLVLGRDTSPVRTDRTAPAA